MECCHLVFACHGSVDFHGAIITTGLRLKQNGRVDGAPRLRVAATSTLPETPGSSRRESFQEPRRLLQTEVLKKTSFQGLTLPSTPSTSGRGEDGHGEEADYTIQLTTSNEDRASLSIANAGIILSLIGEDGEALVQRILPMEEEGASDDLSLRFQRGAVDVAQFRGPNIGRISALWIAPEAGTWRLEQVTVIMTPCEKPKKGMFHRFNAWDIRLGDGEDTPAVELKPSQVLECNGLEEDAAFGKASNNNYAAVKSAQESAKLREESLREYEDMKLFLLGSTAGMVGVGTLGLSLLNAPDVAQGFAVGGGIGLVYLLLIQRAVDQLPSGDNKSLVSNRKVKPPAASFALFVGLALVLTRATQASTMVNLPPQELLAGVLGFFTSKVAVVLAAFRSTGSEKDR